mmetsp:Transcript_6690/g.23044  ORF Transcript_6690/g.23044 Transcript_6690/m.23044 type:complete len:201 (-) Transcript_6690:35-637(-)
MASGDHGDIAVVEPDEVLHLSRLDVKQDGVVDLDKGVWVPQGPSVVGGQGWDGLLAKLDVLDLAKLVGSLLGADAVHSHPSLAVVQDAEVLVGLLQGDDVHEPSWVANVRADLAVDLDVPLHEDGLGLAAGQSVLQAVTQNEDEWQALPGLVWTRRGLGGEDASQLVEHPVLWGIDPLKVLRWSAASHGFASVASVLPLL